MKGNPYIGKIGHSGTQTVKVPQPSEKRGTKAVKTGNDLRVKGGK